MARENIINRTMRVEFRKNRYRFSDWNIVQTLLGAMYEPRILSFIHLGDNTNKFPASELDDPMQRIDRMEFDMDGRDSSFRGSDGMQVHGGELHLGVTRTFSDDTLV